MRLCIYYNQSNHMNLRENIFGNFDFSCLDDEEYKEDSVREDIVAPLLKHIGYSVSGPNKIIRSRSLTHPYVMFGSQKRKLNIIPDYILAIDDNPCFVLDAKSPKSEITKGDNVAQVFSYAIHPEVRAWNYGLCNGRQLALYEVTSTNPKHVYNLTNSNDSTILDINQKLNPRTIKNREILDYALDGGTYLRLVMELPLSMEIAFTNVVIPIIGTISEDHFIINVICTDMGDRELMFTFDFNKILLEKLLKQLSPLVSAEIEEALSSYPFEYKNNINPPSVDISCKQTTDIQFSQKGEMFLPLRVTNFNYTNNVTKA